MKKSIRKILDETFEKKKSWNYYGLDCVKKPFDSKEESVEFIRNYIKLSGKADVVLTEAIEKLEHRAIHVVSTFFFGIYLYENSKDIKKYVSEEINRLIKEYCITSNVGFPFIWFLVCLFHDLGYVFEEQKNEYVTLDEFIQKKSLINLKPIEGIPEHYESILQQYFSYRVEKHGKNDHGICAAYLLFNDLCTIREYQEKEKNSSLCWEKSLEYIYNFASWIILAHNIWYANEINECKNLIYKSKKLGCLVLKENEYKISFEAYPTFFLFCLVDTIEPFKKINYDDSKLNEIFITIKKGKIVVGTSKDSNCDESILCQAYNLKDWLTTTKMVKGNVEIDLIPR